jgi:hypothetical protein
VEDQKEQQPSFARSEIRFKPVVGCCWFFWVTKQVIRLTAKQPGKRQGFIASFLPQTSVVSSLKPR